MRFLGIDYGASRIGIAYSDEGGVLAFPYAVYKNEKAIWENLKNLKEKEGFDEVVVGESRNFQGEENVIMKKTKEFAEKMKKEFGTPIHFEPEFLTTAQAKHTEKKGMRDASAAAIILQSFLDKKNNKK